MWPETEPADIAGDAIVHSADKVFHGSGQHIGSEEELWRAYTEENDGRVYGFESEERMKFVTWREGITLPDKL